MTATSYCPFHNGLAKSPSECTCWFSSPTYEKVEASLPETQDQILPPALVKDEFDSSDGPCDMCGARREEFCRPGCPLYDDSEDNISDDDLLLQAYSRTRAACDENVKRLGEEIAAIDRQLYWMPYRFAANVATLTLILGAGTSGALNFQVLAFACCQFAVATIMASVYFGDQMCVIPPCPIPTPTKSLQRLAWEKLKALFNSLRK